MNPSQYAQSHFDDFIDELKRLVRVPSISFPGFPKEEMDRSAQAVAALLRESGLENVQVLLFEGGNPYVYGDWLHAEGKPTLVLYAHHDVQPVGREELWQSKPFEPEERNGRLYGRGAADDKAGIIVHTSAISSYLRTMGKLPVNVKVIIEGEEEVGSSNLIPFLQKYSQKLAGDVIVITDSGNFDTGVPTITTSLRGHIALEVEVKVMKGSLHSGTWGGPIPDPVMALSKMIATLVDKEGRVAIPGFYDDLRPLNEVEKQSMQLLGYSDEIFRKQAGLFPGVQLLGGDINPWLKKTRLPSIAIYAFQASSRKNAGNIVNDSAWCKIGIRIVPDMDPKKVMKQLQDFLLKQVPWGVHVDLKPLSADTWWMTDPQGPVFEKARRALTKAYGKPTVAIGEGGAIPFIRPFSELLGGAPALLIGVEDPYTNAHAENESVHLGDLKKAILSAVYLYEELGEQ